MTRNKHNAIAEWNFILKDRPKDNKPFLALFQKENGELFVEVENCDIFDGECFYNFDEFYSYQDDINLIAWKHFDLPTQEQISKERNKSE